MYEAQMRIKMNGTDRHPVNLDLAELLAGVCSDIVMDGGTLSLESVENVAYPIPVVNFGNDCTHTYVTGPKLPTLLQRLAYALECGANPRAALIALSGDVLSNLDDGQKKRLHQLRLVPLTRFIARWLQGWKDEAKLLIKC